MTPLPTLGYTYGNAPTLLRPWSFHIVTIRDEVRCCEIREDLNVNHFSSKSRDSSYGGLAVSVQNVPGKTGDASPAGSPHRKAAKSSSKDQVEWLYLWLFLVSP